MWLVATIFNSTGPAAVYLMFERDPEVKRAWFLLEIIGFRDSLASRQSLKPYEDMGPTADREDKDETLGGYHRRG